MKILLCGKKEDNLMINESIKSGFPDTETVSCEDCEDLLRLLADVSFDVAMVVFDGAEGMETVMTLRRQQPDLPVVWLSDDRGFAAQSYRMGTAYFHEKPLTQQILEKAFASCGLAKMEVR